MPSHQQSPAFSLVELSIVLVILGLLTGGILAGQSLIRAAELRSVSTDFAKYQGAINTFRDKYFTIPGDMTTATKFWGSLAVPTTDVTCAFTPANGTATCDGNGDGTLMDYQGFSGSSSQEYGRFWQHLTNAGLIEGGYSGFPGTVTIGTNVAGSKIGGGAYFIARSAYSSGSTYAGSVAEFSGVYGKNMFMLTGSAANVNTAGSMVLKPEEAWNLDTKMDDGLPNQGRIYGLKGLGGGATKTNCTDKAGTFGAASEAGAQYLLNSSIKDCQLYFLNVF